VKKAILFCASILTLAGIINLLPDRELVLKQSIFAIVGIGLFLIISRLNIRFIMDFIRIIYILTVFMLVAVLFLGSGDVKRWFSLGSINIQPSEFAKVVVPLYLTTIDNDLNKLILGLLPSLLVFIEPDLATSSVIVFLTLITIFITTRNLKLFLYIISIPLAAITSFSKELFFAFLTLFSLSFIILRAKLHWFVSAVFSLMILGVITPIIWQKGLKEYQRKRILAMINPEEHKEKLWQTYQSRITLANSKPFGKGIYGATQKLYGYLPASHTDFAFSSFVETYGYVAGGIIIILSFALSILIGLFGFSEDPILRNISLISSSFFTYQVLANLMSVMGILPVAGIPYPFLSYGGSHLITEWMFIALVFSADRWKVS